LTAVVVGTSLGGLMAMLFAMIDAADRGRGVERCRPGDRTFGPCPYQRAWGRAQLSYVDARRPRTEEEQGGSFPDYDVCGWPWPKRVMTVGQNGRIVYVTT
jgi:hypothetical protein